MIYDHKKEIDIINEKMEFEKNLNQKNQREL
jgi:hypothetical protein